MKLTRGLSVWQKTKYISEIIDLYEKDATIIQGQTIDKTMAKPTKLDQTKP